MDKHSNGRSAALLESAGPGTSRPAPSPAHRPRHARAASPARRAKVHESHRYEVVRVPLCERTIEVRVPREAVHAKNRPPQQHIEGFNADATPC
jgi:hypothetical protein